MKFITVRSKLFEPGDVNYIGFMADSFTYVVFKIIEDFVLPKRMKCSMTMAKELEILLEIDINKITNEELKYLISTLEIRIYDTLQQQIIEL